MRPSQSPSHPSHLARRILRPPNIPSTTSNLPRQFSCRHPRLLLASNRILRPQIPFLHPSNPSLTNGQYLRFFSITPDRKKFIQDTARQSVKAFFYISGTVSLLTIASLGFLSERQERAFPSPHEWSLWTRFKFRNGKWWEVPENNDDLGFPNWARLYLDYRAACDRLENPQKDGAGLIELQEGGLEVPGVGKAGFDLSAKSLEWRQGYYEVLLGMARAAERLEGYVTAKNSRYYWLPEYIESPTNPRPKAMPPGQPEPPPKEAQITAAPPPETFYMKILTSKGFTTYQRMTAALGYADWLCFKKLNDSAEEMYRWALDIAIAGLPTPEYGSVVNPDTAVLSATAPVDCTTPNLVDAASNMAIFYASTGRITSALPIFISVLRARLAARPASSTLATPPRDSSVIGTLLTLLHEPEYPPLPPTGDEPLRRREEDRCDEAALKNYIGEILFATAGSSSAQRQQGLNWVRDAVSTSKIAQSLDVVQNDPARKKKCELCEEVGLEAWGKIMTYLAAEAREKRDSALSGGLLNLHWKLWGTKDLEQKAEDLEDEEDGVTMRLNKLRKKMLNEEWADMDRKYARTFVV